MGSDGLGGVVNSSFWGAVAVSPAALTILMETWMVVPYFMPTTGSPDCGFRSEGYARVQVRSPSEMISLVSTGSSVSHETTAANGTDSFGFARIVAWAVNCGSAAAKLARIMASIKPINSGGRAPPLAARADCLYCFFRSTTHSQCASPRTMFLVNLNVKFGFRLSVAPSPQA